MSEPSLSEILITSVTGMQDGDVVYVPARSMRGIGAAVDPELHADKQLPCTAGELRKLATACVERTRIQTAAPVPAAPVPAGQDLDDND